jgi:hypothetical protein
MPLLRLFPLPSAEYSAPLTRKWPEYPIDRNRVRKADPIDLMIGVRPSVVEPALKPIDVVVTLPSITGDSRVKSGGNSCSTNETTDGGETTVSEGGDWLCRLSTWVDGNPLLAVAAIAGVFVVMGNSRRQR